MKYIATEFVDYGAPFITAAEMNKIGNAIAEIGNRHVLEIATFNTALSTTSNYNITLVNYPDKPAIEEFPIVIIFTPSLTNTIGSTITVQWDSTQYPIFDTSTNAAISAGEVKMGQPIQMIFDGQKFWVDRNGSNLKYGIINGTAGFWDHGNTDPTSTGTRINWNGTFFASEVTASKVYGTVYNRIGADVAEGYPVSGDVSPGDLIMISGDEEYKINTIPLNTRALGFVSDSYAALYGSDYGDTPIAVCGRVPVRVDGKCVAGDLLVAGEKHGTVKVAPDSGIDIGAIVAKALHGKSDCGVGLVLAKVVL